MACQKPSPGPVCTFMVVLFQPWMVSSYGHPPHPQMQAWGRGWEGPEGKTHLAPNSVCSQDFFNKLHH